MARRTGGAERASSSAPWCSVDAMRAMGLWSAADDAEIERRYGPDAITGHVYCCDPVAREARYAAMRAAISPCAPGMCARWDRRDAPGPLHAAKAVREAREHPAPGSRAEAADRGGPGNG